MARWQKSFDKWRTAKAPVNVDEVVPLLNRVFGDRFVVNPQAKHEYQISVPELREDPRFRFEILVLPTVGGQKVKAFYLQRAYEVAVLLGLYPPAEDEDAESEDVDSN